MKEQYRHELDQIHAPKALIEQTKRKMEQQQQKTTIKIIIQRTSLAAVFLLVCGFGSYGYYITRNQIAIQDVSQTSLSISPKFGKRAEKTQEKENFVIQSGSEKSVIPDYLWEVTPSKIKGQEIYLGKDKENTFYAGFKKEEKYTYIIGKNTSEKEFIEYIKNLL